MGQHANAWRQRARWFYREWFRPLLIVVVVCTSFRSAVADWNDVPTGSMKPTLLEGDRILVNKLAYDLKVPYTTWHLWEWGHPEPGDIVVCYSPANGDRLVKRVIAVPGDELELRANTLVINGRPAAYETLDQATIDWIPAEVQPRHRFALEHLGDGAHAVMATLGVPAQRSFGPVVVPEDMYFLMGDNRDNSADSRMFGFVPRGEIVGRTSRLAFSLDRENGYWPRWARTGFKLD